MNIQAILQYVKSLRGDEKGVTTVEYAVMLVLVALAVAAFGSGINTSVTGVFGRVVTALAPAP